MARWSYVEESSSRRRVARSRKYLSDQVSRSVGCWRIAVLVNSLSMVTRSSGTWMSMGSCLTLVIIWTKYGVFLLNRSAPVKQGHNLNKMPGYKLNYKESEGYNQTHQSLLISRWSLAILIARVYIYTVRPISFKTVPQKSSLGAQSL